MNILVTGAKGFIGRNLIATLHNIADGKDRSFEMDSDLTVFEYDVDTDPVLLDGYCKNADFVFNLAGVNRPQTNEEFMQGNFGFASTLLDITSFDSSPEVVISCYNIHIPISQTEDINMLNRTYAEYATEKAVSFLAIDSPTGYTKAAAEWVRAEFAALGYPAEITVKGGVLIDLGGETSPEGGLLLAAHADTLGGMVAEIKGNGRLRLTNLGGMKADNGETENVRVHTRSGRVIEGTLQLCNASVHVNGEYSSSPRNFNTTEVVLDEDVNSAADTRALGIEVGDIVAFEPRTRVTASGYIKSRFLDDKASAAVLLALAKMIADENITLKRSIWISFTVYEEVGHGACHGIPDGIVEMMSVDMGCVGETMTCTEKQVSICAKDSGGPYSYEVVGKLIEAAKAEEADYAVDIYPYYGSDVEATLSAGYDIRHGLIGAGVYASHGYERSHIDGVYNTLKVLVGYLGLA